jgi:hypothetical protein
MDGHGGDDAAAKKMWNMQRRCCCSLVQEKELKIRFNVTLFATIVL